MTVTLGVLVWCPECDQPREVEAESFAITVMEQEKPIRVEVVLYCEGCGAVLV